MKLTLSFTLMSVIPIIMLILMAGWFGLPTVREFYQLDRWFPILESPTAVTWWLLGLITLTILIAFLGSVYLTVKLIAPVVRLSQEAKEIAVKGEFDRRVSVMEDDDELGDLSEALNQLTAKIRTNMAELNKMGEKTNEINLEINKRVVMLSGLLQIGELLGSGTELDVVLELIVEKLATQDDQGFSLLLLQPVEDLSFTLKRTSQLDVNLLHDLPVEVGPIAIDCDHPPSQELRALWEQLGKPNLILQPVTMRAHRAGVLGMGNRRGSYLWMPEWLDLVKVFAKQTSIAIENEVLLRKAKTLAIRDELTGVYNERYIKRRLEEEIKRAIMYQRPCGLLMFRTKGLSAYRQQLGEPEAERFLKKVARFIQESVTEIDRVGRFAGNEIVVVLPERNKRQAMEISEELGRRMVTTFEEFMNGTTPLTLEVGIAENPLDGITGEDLIEKASASLHSIGVVAPSGGAA
ncbi:MAG: diguanylate cyclase [Candidatus Omnitrophica bacterium]|nr:diguanylate cyclase [Candidatus Omnitrophota bacterium]